MSVHNRVKLLEQEHGALDAESKKAFEQLARKRFTVFYAVVLAVNVALLLFAVIYVFVDDVECTFLTCVNTDRTPFLKDYAGYIAQMGSVNVTFPLFGNFSCVPQETNGLSYTIDSIAAVVVLVGGIVMHWRVEPSNKAIAFVDVFICAAVYILNMIGPFFTLDTFYYVIPTLLGTRMGFGIAAFMILWKYVVALLPFDNVWFFVSPQLIFFLYDLGVTIPATVEYYNADMIWFLILDTLCFGQLVFSAVKQARLDSQTLAMQAKHVRMQALKFGADQSEVACMLLEERTLTEQEIRDRKFPWRLPDGSMRLGEALGSGSQAKVYKATYQGAEVACKVMWDFHSDAVQVLATEASTLWSLQKHPFLLTFYGVAKVSPPEIGKRWAMIFEWCPITLLAKLQNRVSPWPVTPFEVHEEQAKTLRETAAGIACLHNVDIQHCDLKPENIFFGQDGHVRVADFGISNKSTLRIPKSTSMRYRGPKTTIESIGTPGYIAPPLLRLSNQRPSSIVSSNSEVSTAAASQRSGGTFSLSGIQHGVTPNHAATSFDYRIHDAFAYIVVAFEVLVGRLPYVAGAFMAQLMDGDYVDTAIAEALGSTCTIHPKYKELLLKMFDTVRRSAAVSFSDVHDSLEKIETGVPELSSAARKRLTTSDLVFAKRRDVGRRGSPNSWSAPSGISSLGSDSSDTQSNLDAPSPRDRPATTLGYAPAVSSLGSINLDDVESAPFEAKHGIAGRACTVPSGRAHHGPLSQQQRRAATLGL